MARVSTWLSSYTSEESIIGSKGGPFIVFRRFGATRTTCARFPRKFSGHSVAILAQGPQACLTTATYIVCVLAFRCRSIMAALDMGAPVEGGGGHPLGHPAPALPLAVVPRDLFRFRHCPLCNLLILEPELLAHRKVCGAAVYFVYPMADPIGLIGGTPGIPMKHVHAYVGGYSHDTQVLINKIMARFRRHAPFTTSRPQHCGAMIPIGVSLDGNFVFPHTAEFKQSLADFYHTLFATPVFNSFTLCANHPRMSQVATSFPKLPPLSVPGVPGAINVFVGFGYTQQLVGEAHMPAHPPPAPVARILKCGSCQDLCPTCSTTGCESCGACVMHKDPSDRSLTVSVFSQPARTLLNKTTLFVIGSQAFAVRGGLIVIFDGRQVSHGIWNPRLGPISDCHHMAFVVRSG